MSELFWGHDSEAMGRMDREAEASAFRKIDEIARLEKQRSSDYDAHMRSGGADKLLRLTAGRR